MNVHSNVLIRTARAAALCLALVAGTLPVACGGAADAPHIGQGVVRGVEAAPPRVTIEHGDISGLMKAMTMTFAVSDPSLLEGVQEGDRIDFEVRYADGTYTVIALKKR